MKKRQIKCNIKPLDRELIILNPLLERNSYCQTVIDRFGNLTLRNMRKHDPQAMWAQADIDIRVEMGILKYKDR
jgi:hypothetical protein